MGDRMALIGRAVALLAKSLPPGHILLSDYIESVPWGFDSSNPFLNRGLLLITETNLHPEKILDITQNVEIAVGKGTPHRNSDGSYCDRPIDIDIIDIDGIRYQSPRLILPHPHAESRPFVLIPMQSLNRRSNHILHNSF